jgi:CRP-like cAMP-binding protein
MTHLSLKFPAPHVPVARAERLPAMRADAPGGDRATDWLTTHFDRALRRRLPAGAQLFHEGAETAHLYVFLRGLAMKYKSLPDGRRQILDFVLPGEPLGFVVARPAPYAIETLSDSEVAAIGRGAFDALIGSDPRFARALCRQFEDAGARAHERMTSISYRSARVRVCQLLAELVDRAEPNGAPDSVAMAMPLSQRHLADATALRVETVCRMLTQLDEEGIATLRRGQLRVPDMQALRDAC